MVSALGICRSFGGLDSAIANPFGQKGAATEACDGEA